MGHLPSSRSPQLPVAAVAVALLAVLLIHCSEGGSSSVICNPPCSVGTCCLNGQCVIGNQPSACGTSGGECSVCGPGASCVNGSCGGSSTCGPGFCSGCCSGNTCLLFTQQSPSQCGTGGYPCASCGTGQCTNGVCSTEPTTCGPSTCDGCCNGNQCLRRNTVEQSSSLCGTSGNPCTSCGGQPCTNGECQNPTSPCGYCPQGCCQGTTCLPYANQGAAACGTNNATCAPCPAPNVCTNGICGGSTSCGPGLCLGCCQGNTCLLFGQQSPTACGKDGVNCGPCSGNTPHCKDGSCQGCHAGTCGDGCCSGSQCLRVNVEQTTAACGKSGNSCSACGTDQKCIDGECLIPWRVIAVSAEVLPDGDPDEWDKNTGGSPPDPMAKCSVVGGKSGETTTASNTYVANWNEELFTESQARLQNGLTCEVRDDDWPWGSEHMGNCTFSLTFATSPATFDGACSSFVKSMKVQLIKF